MPLGATGAFAAGEPGPSYATRGKGCVTVARSLKPSGAMHRPSRYIVPASCRQPCFWSRLEADGELILDAD
jgi:hypothetical protein